jgi:hypothetical protein
MFKRMWQLLALLSMGLLLGGGCGFDGLWHSLFNWQKISQAVIMDSIFD